MPKDLSCTQCGEPMEFGFVPDATYGGVLQSRWHPGPVEQQTFLGMDVGEAFGLKFDKKKTLPITALRCTGCGLLRFYAKDKPNS